MKPLINKTAGGGKPKLTRGVLLFKEREKGK